MPKTRRCRPNKAGFPGKRCTGCKVFLGADRKDHYCGDCRLAQEKRRKQKDIVTDDRWRGGELVELLAGYL